MLSLENHPHLAPFDASFKAGDWPTAPPSDQPGKKVLKRELRDLANELDELQRKLYAHDRYAVLLVFQALDAAGKDSTIRAVFNRIDPNGVFVHPFKTPNSLELEHDFLWRTTHCLPRRGNIGIFNRSYYEEVLVVRVHPEYLDGQRLPPYKNLDALWQQRYKSIRDHELHLAQSGTVVIKFWLKHSREEQKNRFLSRLEEPGKQWKFSFTDVKERQHWDQYMRAYEEMINATSRPWAPWYVIPADKKPYMRVQVAQIVKQTLSEMDIAFPKVDEKQRKALLEMEEKLRSGEV
jgi:PPK2 family polyphosphate:nucleotide phosphotransferase